MTRKEVLDKLQNLFGAGTKDQDIEVFKAYNANIVVYASDFAINAGNWELPLMAARMSRIQQISLTRFSVGGKEHNFLTIYIKSREEDFFNIRLN